MLHSYLWQGYLYNILQSVLGVIDSKNVLWLWLELNDVLYHPEKGSQSVQCCTNDLNKQIIYFEVQWMKITLQGHIRESWGWNLCLVQIQELLETASTKTPVRKYKMIIITLHSKIDTVSHWLLRLISTLKKKWKRFSPFPYWWPPATT